MHLEEIIEDIQLESDKLEAKSILNREDVIGWLKSIAGFANASDVEYDWDKLTNLRDFYKKHNEGDLLKEKALKSLGFVNENGYLFNGVMMFLDDYKEKKTEVQCSVFSGFNRGSERIVTINYNFPKFSNYTKRQKHHIYY